MENIATSVILLAVFLMIVIALTVTLSAACSTKQETEKRDAEKGEVSSSVLTPPSPQYDKSVREESDGDYIEPEAEIFAPINR